AGFPGCAPDQTVRIRGFFFLIFARKAKKTVLNGEKSEKISAKIKKTGIFLLTNADSFYKIIYCIIMDTNIP
ncbi:MAG: hypothetical protein IJK40_06960, partial [Clostridia bacterium]|nr:hypothetical protein [Clostridia bacterium]